MFVVGMESNSVHFHKIIPEDKRRTTKIGYVRAQDTLRFPNYPQNTIF
jgi:hypothetical protein